MCILGLSKVLMYEFHCDYNKNKYGKNSGLLFTDIHSLTGVYEGLSKDKNMFDFSSYLTKSKLYDDSNKLAVGKMKDETGGISILD